MRPATRFREECFPASNSICSSSATHSLRQVGDPAVFRREEALGYFATLN